MDFSSANALNLVKSKNLSYGKELTLYEVKKIDNINMTQKLKCNLGQVGNVVEKGEKCWLQAFSPNTTMFSKSFFSPRHQI